MRVLARTLAAVFLENLIELVQLVGIDVEMREIGVALGFSSSATFAFMALRSYRWNASPSMKAASIFSRRKICSKMRFTEVVPAPDEPVIEMMGCFADMISSSTQTLNRPRLPNSGARSPMLLGSV